MKNLVCVLILIMFSGSLLFSETKFSAQVSSNRVSAGDRIQVTFKLDNAKGSSFRAPTFKGFTVLSGPNTSQSTQWINGNVSSSISYTYIIKADKQGKFTIGSASIVADGKTLRTKTISIEVIKGKPDSDSKQSNEEINLNQQAEDIVHKNLFLKLYVDKKQAYEGEPIVATYKLYVHPQLQLLNLGQPTMPTFNGFWTQDLGIKELKFKNETLNGVTYRVANLKKVVLLAQQSGKLEIEPMEIESVVRLRVQGRSRRNRSPFNDPFFSDFFSQNYRDFKFVIKSRSSSIDIKSLPAGAPAEFNGAVGDLSLSASIDKQDVKTGDAVTLKVKITGRGNLKLIDAFPLNLPNDIDAFDPKINENISISSSGMSGSKTFEYYLIPQNPGTYKIEPVIFSYFDLSEKKYKTLKSRQFVLNVKKGRGNAASVISGVNKKNVEYIGKDIRYIKTSNKSIRPAGNSFIGSLYFYVLLLLPFILFIFIFLYAKRREELNRDVRLLKNRKANSIAKKRLSSAKSYIDKNLEDEFYEEISKVLIGYVCDKLGILHSELTREKARTELMNRKVDEDLISRLESTIDYCESVRFAPSSEKISVEKVYNDSSKIITELEGVLR